MRSRVRLLGAYLHQPYAWFLRRNSAEIGKDVLQESIAFVGMVLAPALKIMSSLLIAIVILAFLLALNPLVAPDGGADDREYLCADLPLAAICTPTLGREMLAANSERFRLATRQHPASRKSSSSGWKTAISDDSRSQPGDLLAPQHSITPFLNCLASPSKRSLLAFFSA
jgi:hypothetical protein